MGVLRAYYKALEDGESRPRHRDLADRVGCSVFAVGRVLRWARREGLPVASGPRDPVPSANDAHQAARFLAANEDRKDR